MKKLSPFFALAVSVCGADFWQSKPFTDWSDKEVQKMETNSPWSKQVSIAMGEGGGSGRGGGRGSRAGGGGSVGGEDTTVATGAGGSTGGRSQDSGTIGGGGTSMTITVSWRTALPMRQAVAKMKYPGDAITSPDAKKMIEEDQKYYGILVSGLPAGSGRGGGERMKDALMKNTTLSVKGKELIQVADIQTGGNEQKPVVLFLFPRTVELSVDDKDVEFSTKLGPLMVKQKFHLKDMVLNGKLEL
jgi:hypothetical protein